MHFYFRTLLSTKGGAILLHYPGFLLLFYRQFTTGSMNAPIILYELLDGL